MKSVPTELCPRTEDGVQLSVRVFPASSPKAVLLCGHAMMANGRYFHRAGHSFAANLAEQGVSTYVFDFRGHGQSVPPSPRARPGFCFDDYVRYDLPAVWEAVSAHAGVASDELCYLGHSLGGLAGLAAIGTGTVVAPRRLSLWAVSLWLEGKGGSLSRRAIMGLYRVVAEALGYAPIRRLRLGSDDESLGYVQQLSDWALHGAWTSRSGTDYEASLESIEVPTLVVVGEGDRLCGPADVERFRRQLSGALPLRVVGQRHGDAIDPNHFSLFTDTRMRPAWRELAQFLY